MCDWAFGGNRDELVGQFRAIIVDLDARVAKANARKTTAEEKRDAQEQELQVQLTREREYFEAVRELHELLGG